MTKIIINVPEIEDEPSYTTEGTITISDEADATGYVEACVQAMKIEGYAEISIMQALYENYWELKESLSVVSGLVEGYEKETA